MALVDHNEKSQAVNGIESAEILEIIDHHKLGDIETIAPVFFRNQLGRMYRTIVYQMYQNMALILIENCRFVVFCYHIRYIDVPVLQHVRK